jgi:tripartite-type tricarboxylate transporter receptor subunit TctC
VFAYPARADEVSDFYKGKSIEMHIAYTAGGGYDIYARILSRYIGNHIPGRPSIIPKNSPGAGGLRLVNWLYSAAPKDGTILGAIGRTTPFEPLIGISGAAKFDAVKFNYIGSATNEVSVCAVWHTTGITRFEDAIEKEVKVGGSGPSGDTDVFPPVLNGIFGTKFRLITGYPGGNDIDLAMERGEVDGRCGWSWSSIVSSHSDWLKEKKLNVLMQLALTKHPDLPNTPLIMDLAKSDEQRQMLRLVFASQTLGRPYLTAPSVPAARVAALRKAFDATMKDPRFQQDAGIAKLELNPVRGEEVQQLIEDVFTTPKPITEKVRAMLGVVGKN